MRAILAAALVLAAGPPRAIGPQRSILPLPAYEALVEEYRVGDAEKAVVRAATMEFRLTLEEDFTKFMQDPDTSLVMAAAALHAEAALRPRVEIAPSWAGRHLRLAATIVEIGTPPKMKRLGSIDLRRSRIAPVSPQFRRLWFLAAATAMQHDGRLGLAKLYLDNARTFFPHDSEFLLLSAITEEMAASTRLLDASAGERRKALGDAEAYLRESLALAPDRVETRLRLGRVLAERGQAKEARALLTAVAGLPDERLSYLAALFLGGLEDAAGDSPAAANWYARASARIPAAQAARLAASELHHRAGERQTAVTALPAAIGPNNTDDPWWGYLFGEYWRVDLYLDAMRKMARS
jgi:tetratricopeptide (TPR) repeat protein